MLAGCSSTVPQEAPPEEVLSPSQRENLSPLSTDQLVEIAGQCRDQIGELHKERFNLPPVKQKVLALSLGRASDACEKLRGLLSQVKIGSFFLERFEKSLEEARQSSGEGGRVESVPSSYSQAPIHQKGEIQAEELPPEGQPLLLH